MMRTLKEIAREIRADWKNISPHARPYLDAMEDLTKIEEKYMADTAESVVLYFLVNAGTWRGPVARRVKEELRALARSRGHPVP